MEGGGINAQKCVMAAMHFKNIYMYLSKVYFCEVYPKKILKILVFSKIWSFLTILILISIWSFLKISILLSTFVKISIQIWTLLKISILIKGVLRNIVPIRIWLIEHPYPRWSKFPTLTFVMAPLNRNDLKNLFPRFAPNLNWNTSVNVLV